MADLHPIGRALAGVALLLALQGRPVLADGAIVAPGDALTLAADEGFVFLAFDLADDLDELKFHGPGKWLAKFSIPRLARGESSLLLRLPVGDYCFESFRSGSAVYRRIERDRVGYCFKAMPGAINYPGQIVIRGNGAGKVTTRFEFQPRRFLERMTAEFPAMLDGRFRVAGASSVGGEWITAQPFEFVMAAYDAGNGALGDRLLAPVLIDPPNDVLIELGMRHLEGDGLPRDRERAMRYLAQAADKGSRQARELMCYAAFDPERIDLADEQAVRAAATVAAPYCRASAEAGNLRSQRIYANMARDGVGLPRDAALAHRWDLAAAEQGDVGSMVQAATALREGRGVAVDKAAAAGWFEKAVAADSAEAKGELAAMLASGDGVAVDVDRAITLWREAASAQHAPSQLALAKRHARGDGVKLDPQLAKEMFELAARRDPAAKLAYAWHLATHPDAAQRDGRRARQLAREGLAARGGLPEDRMVLAAAHAEFGDVLGAMREAQAAIDALAKSAPTDRRLAAWRAQRAVYTKNQAWREP